jgi:hypothetical protein
MSSYFHDVVVRRIELSNHCIMTVEAGTNTPKGGNTGAGGRTVIRFIDEGGTDWDVWVTSPENSYFRGRKLIHPDDYEHRSPHSVEFVLKGDAEAENMIVALRFAADVLESRSSESVDGKYKDVPGVHVHKATTEEW